MRILIRNPAPDNQVIQCRWGDFHFGNSLAQSLSDLGCKVEQQYWPNWVEAEADVLLVLRGLRETVSIDGEFNKKVIWIISHPEDVSYDEMRLFDIVLTGSSIHTHELSQLNIQARTFLQCTDDRIFFQDTSPKHGFNNAFIFVGNYRGAGRPLVGRAIGAQLPIKIWGSFWDKKEHSPVFIDQYYPNENLGELYRNSYCTLNDHWADMITFQYVNNRVFDSLACGLPILSEPNQGMEKLELQGIRLVNVDDNFNDVIDEFIVNYDRYLEGAGNDAVRIMKEHTFKVRAKQLLELLQ